MKKEKLLKTYDQVSKCELHDERKTFYRKLKQMGLLDYFEKAYLEKSAIDRHIQLFWSTFFFSSPSHLARTDDLWFPSVPENQKQPDSDTLEIVKFC